MDKFNPSSKKPAITKIERPKPWSKPPKLEKYIKIQMNDNSERFVPAYVYEQTKTELEKLKQNTKKLPKPIKWFLKKSIKNIDPEVHAEIALKELIYSIEELGGDIVWRKIKQ